MTLYRLMQDEFTSEEVRFLRYILSLILKAHECKKVDSKLQDRILLLESLIERAPDPTYFKGMTQKIQRRSELSV